MKSSSNIFLQPIFLQALLAARSAGLTKAAGTAPSAPSIPKKKEEAEVTWDARWVPVGWTCRGRLEDLKIFCWGWKSFTYLKTWERWLYESHLVEDLEFRVETNKIEHHIPRIPSQS